MGVGLESKQLRFIDSFLKNVAGTNPTSNLIAIALSNVQPQIAHTKIHIEKPLEGRDVPANGSIKYVIHIGGRYAVIVEAKQSDFFKSRAQNYLECEVGLKVGHIFLNSPELKLILSS